MPVKEMLYEQTNWMTHYFTTFTLRTIVAYVSESRKSYIIAYKHMETASDGRVCFVSEICIHGYNRWNSTSKLFSGMYEMMIHFATQVMLHQSLNIANLAECRWSSNYSFHNNLLLSLHFVLFSNTMNFIELMKSHNEMCKNTQPLKPISYAKLKRSNELLALRNMTGNKRQYDAVNPAAHI